MIRFAWELGSIGLLRSAPVLILSTVLGVGVTLEGYAQTPEPIVSVTPSYKLMFAGGSMEVEVGIFWCQPDEGFWVLQEIIQSYPGGETDVTSQFENDTQQHSAPPFCRGPNDYWEHWTGTITVQPGKNFVDACAYTFDAIGGCGTGVYEFAPPHRSVTISAAAQQADVLPGSPTTVQFTVTNTGGGQETFNLAGSCSGSAVPSCNPISPAQLTLGAGQAGTATVSFTAGGTVGQTGYIDVTATHSTESTITSATWTEVVVVDAPAPGVVAIGLGGDFERDRCLTVSAGPSAAVECGDLRIVHSLPAVRTMNKARVPTLVYNSRHAEAISFVSADVTLPSGEPLPGSVHSTLTVTNLGSYIQDRSGAEWGAPGGTRRITLPMLAWQPYPGIFDYQLEVRRITGASNTHFQTISGKLAIVHRAESPFGAGWWLAGLERIQSTGQGNDFVWIGGDGSTRLYRESAPDVFTAIAIDRADTLTFDYPFFHRHTSDGGLVRFDLSGLHVATVSRLGHTTSFGWTVVAGRQVLSSISVPMASGSLTYIFQYNTNGQLTSVLSPGPDGTTRTTTVTVNTTNGRIDQITDPDLETVSFGYGPSNPVRIMSRTDRRGYTTSYTYDAAGLIARHSVTLANGQVIAQDYRPVESVGHTGVSAALPPDSAYSRIDGPRSDVADVAKFWFNRAGMLTRTRDPLGRETRIVYGDAIFPGLATEVRDRTRLVTRSFYNSRGLPDSTKVLNPLGTGLDAKTTYTWHSK